MKFRKFTSIWCILSFFAVLVSCSEPHPGFTEINENTFFKWHTLGEGPQLKDLAYAEWEVSLGLLRDAYPSYQSSFGVEMKDQDFWVKDPELLQSILNLSLEDSVSFLVPFSFLREGVFDEFSNDGVGVNDTVMMRLDLKVRNTMDSLAYADYQYALRLEREAKESFELQRWMEGKGNIGEFDLYQGVYWRFLDSIPDGENVQYGEEIAVKLKGTFLDGKVFDVAKDSSEYIYFPLGKSGQVVRAIELILPKMSVGERTELVCPPFLAFGNQGSTSGIVPPKTPLIFEVELMPLPPVVD